MRTIKSCPHCGKDVEQYRNPLPTVDILIHDAERGVVLIERRNEPYGWALPGGFVDVGESCETAAVREAREETGLDVELTGLVGVYSDPDRDPRHHTVSVVYTARCGDPDALAAGDDAGDARWFKLGDWPELAFDHARILDEWLDRADRSGAGG